MRSGNQVFTSTALLGALDQLIFLELSLFYVNVSYRLTEDSVDGLISEDIGDRGGHTELLVHHIKTSHVEVVGGEVSVARSGSVLDREALSVLLVGRRLNKEGGCLGG